MTFKELLDVYDEKRSHKKHLVQIIGKNDDWNDKEKPTQFHTNSPILKMFEKYKVVKFGAIAFDCIRVALDIDDLEEA